VINTAEVETRMLWDSQQVENTLYFNRAAGWDTTSLTTLGDSIISWWAESYSTQAGIALELKEVTCTDLTTSTSPAVTVVPAVATLGDINNASLPNNVSIAVSFRTALRGRSFRGRNYFAGLCENQVIDNEVGPTVVSAIRLIYLGLLEVASDSEAQWVVVSRFSGIDPVTKKPIPRETGISTPINAVVIVDPVVDSMRRRLPKRGK
jgi:hypothetical protein